MDDNFTVSLAGFNGEGIGFQIRVAGESFDEWVRNVNQVMARFPQLGDFQTLYPSPPDSALRPKTYHIVGWLRGETRNKQLGELTPCVYLYADAPWLKFTIGTVYFEDLDKLPASQVDWQNARSVGNAAPPVDRARQDWHACDFHATFAPRLDAEGEPEKTDSGKIRYRFVSASENESGAPAKGAETPVTPASTPAQPVARQVSVAPAAAAPAQPQAKPAPTAARRVTTAPATARKAVGKPVSVPVNAKAQGSVEEPFPMEHLNAYVDAYTDPDYEVTPQANDFVLRMRQLDKESTVGMSRTAVDPEGNRSIGQYDFLCGMLDTMIENETGMSNKHKEFLSYLLGRPIDKDNVPGNRTRAIFDELWEGDDKNANPKRKEESVDAFAEIAMIVKHVYQDGILMDDGDSGVPF